MSRLNELGGLVGIRRKLPGQDYVASETLARELETPLVWSQRETTDPLQMPASLRYALLHEREDYSDEKSGFSAVPYHKTLDGEAQLMLVRHRYKKDAYPRKVYSLDVGQIEDNSFVSKGWVDFSIVPRTFGLWRSALDYEREIGELDRAHYHHPIFDRSSPGLRVNRSRFGNRQMDKGVDRDVVGIYVPHEYRRKGIATSLVSSARAILSSEGVQRLYISELLLDEGLPSVPFYEGIGGRVFNLPNPIDKYPDLVIVFPTAASERYPYRFV